jgi:membrane protease YdiL (CAAX protease family)
MALHPPEPQWLAQLRVILPPLLAAASAVLVDRLCTKSGFLPPGFARPWRRFLGFLVLSLFFWIALYGNLANLGTDTPPLDLTRLSATRLFYVHFLMLGTTLVWFLAGYAGVAPPSPRPVPPPVPPPAGLAPPPEPLEMPEPLEPAEDTWPDGLPPLAPPRPVPPAPRPPFLRVLAAQFGLLAPNLPREIGVGLLVGVGSWFAVLLAALVLALLLYLVGAEGAAPKEPPELVVWIAALPLVVRLLASLSAGVVEETFFRGFLQPRVGLWLSTAFFVLGHLAYGQPLLLVGIAILSLIYGTLVRWRQTIWPAIAAHALFDGVQLLIVIPTTLKLIGKG